MGTPTGPYPLRPTAHWLEIEQPKKKIFSREVTKRSLKTFTTQRWRETLATKDWESIISCENLDEKVVLYNKAIQESLDEIAPVRTFKVRSHHKFGLSDQTKALMKKFVKTIPI